jgi:hypothetical protein
MSRFIFLPFEVKGILKGHPVPYPAAYKRLAAFGVGVVGPCTEIPTQTKRVFHTVRSGYVFVPSLLSDGQAQGAGASLPGPLRKITVDGILSTGSPTAACPKRATE